MDKEKTALDVLSDMSSELMSNRCTTKFNIISLFKEGYGDRFDDLDFVNYATGKYVKGAELRDCQTGCEIFERLGWSQSEFRHPIFQCRCKQYDEQLRFVSEKGKPLSNIKYRLTLGDGRILAGNTDSDGKSMRIRSANKPLAIERAAFFIPDNMPRCPHHGCRSGKTEETVKQIRIKGIETNRENVGSSFQTVIVKIKDRPLTAGEIAMSRLVFQDSIDYSMVRVHNEEYLPFGFQDDKVAMTPKGEIYFNPERYKEDYSIENNVLKIWFIHEMVHVWQYQLGYRVTWHGFWLAMKGGYVGESAYRYDRTDFTKTLSDYNMEQQGDIISEYFGAKYLSDGRFTAKLPFLESVLREFIRRPKNAALLPK